MVRKFGPLTNDFVLRTMSCIYSPCTESRLLYLPIPLHPIRINHRGSPAIDHLRHGAVVNGLIRSAVARGWHGHALHHRRWDAEIQAIFVVPIADRPVGGWRTGALTRDPRIRKLIDFELSTGSRRHAVGFDVLLRAVPAHAADGHRLSQQRKLRVGK